MIIHLIASLIPVAFGFLFGLLVYKGAGRLFEILRKLGGAIVYPETKRPFYVKAFRFMGLAFMVLAGLGLLLFWSDIFFGS